MSNQDNHTIKEASSTIARHYAPSKFKMVASPKRSKDDSTDVTKDPIGKKPKRKIRKNSILKQSVEQESLLDLAGELISQDARNINALSEMGGEVYNAAADKKKASKQLIKGLKEKVRDLGNDKLSIDTGDEHAVIVQIVGLQ